jgi:GTP-binding protein EngB required for normal cell division
MNIKIIGSKMKQFYEKVQDTQKSIKDLWNFEPLKENESTTLQINNYFEKLNKNLEDDSNINQNIREVLILKIRSVYDSEVNLLIDLMNKLEEVQYMPLVLLLHTDNHEQKLTIDTNEYKQIDQRLIFIHKFSEDSETIEKEIDPILLRFCSIHNDLGDRFVIGNQEKNNENNFDLVDKYFPFNINIACIGRFRQGKSTGVNMILKEYKAKESSKGCSQTKNLSYYQVRGKPIRILDIPGFEDDYTVYEAVKKFEECGKKINRLKEQIHIILYFMNCLEEGTFMNFEYKMIKEMIKHKKSKIIYVITHSPSNLNENEKKKENKKYKLRIKKNNR